MKKTILLLIACIFSTSACSLYHISSEDITTNYYPSKQRANDVLLLEDVDRPHEVIGTVIVNAERRQYLSEVIWKMKREAAILGGDAITDIKTDATGAWKELPAQAIIGNGYVRTNFSATIIVFK